MRSPRVNRLLQFNDEKKHGLSEYLAGIDSVPNFENSIHDNLKILLSGAQNANSPGLIASSRMQSLIDYCNEKFDYIIIDTPPVNIVSDAILLNDYINGYILVCRADYSDVNSLSDAMDNLTKAGATIYGTVLSSYNAKVGKKYGRYGRYSKYARYSRYGRYGRYARYGYGRYGYGYGYGYGSSGSSNSSGNAEPTSKIESFRNKIIGIFKKNVE